MALFLILFGSISDPVHAAPFSEIHFFLSDWTVLSDTGESALDDLWALRTEVEAFHSMAGWSASVDEDFGNEASASVSAGPLDAIGVAAVGNSGDGNDLSVFSRVASESFADESRGEATSRARAINVMSLPGDANRPANAHLLFEFSAFLFADPDAHIETAGQLSVDMWFFDPVRSEREVLLEIREELGGGSVGNPMTFGDRVSRSFVLEPDRFYPIFLEVETTLFVENEAFSGTTPAVPEPGTVFLLFSGLLGMGLFRKISKRNG